MNLVRSVDLGLIRAISRLAFRDGKEVVEELRRNLVRLYEEPLTARSDIHWILFAFMVIPFIVLLAGYSFLSSVIVFKYLFALTMSPLIGWICLHVFMLVFPKWTRRWRLASRSVPATVVGAISLIWPFLMFQSAWSVSLPV